MGGGHATSIAGSLGSGRARAERHRDRLRRHGAVDRLLPPPRSRLPRGRRGPHRGDAAERRAPHARRGGGHQELPARLDTRDRQPARARIRDAPARPRSTSSTRASRPPASRRRRSPGTRSGASATRSCAIPSACPSTCSPLLSPRLDVTGTRRVRGCCCARRLRELGEDVRDVPMDGVLAEHQRARDLSVREAGGDEPQHLRLASGQG